MRVQFLATHVSQRVLQLLQLAELKALLHDGTLGDVYAADPVFHNAYGPDKPWFYDASLAGGGCVMDLGIHLVDLLLWALDSPIVERVDGQLYASGHRLARPTEAVESPRRFSSLPPHRPPHLFVATLGRL